MNKYWKDSEGDNWFDRNKDYIGKNNLTDIEIIDKIKKYNINNNNILEIGCSDGSRLNYLYKEFNCNCYGIDPSKKAINSGKKIYTNLNLLNLSSDNLHKFDDNFFDIVIFGHCLMVIDSNTFHKIIYDVNRILNNNGHIFIVDWYNKYEKKNIPWKHNLEMVCHKYDYSNLFTIFPNYVLINRTFLNHDNKEKKYEFDNLDEVMTIDLIRKL